MHYTWSDEGKPQEGTITLRDRGAVWTDTWHQPKSVECSETAGSWGLLALQYAYSAGGSDWGWRILLAQRPSGELLLEMTNVAPRGEEMRAVRMVFTRKT